MNKFYDTMVASCFQIIFKEYFADSRGKNFHLEISFDLFNN
jgi:hypothetical protein